MSADINPVECGLGFAIKLNKPDFIGKEALLKPQTRKRIGLKIVGKALPAPMRMFSATVKKSASSPRAAPHPLSAAIMQWHSFPPMPMKTALGPFPFAAESSTASLHLCPSTRGNKHIYAAHPSAPHKCAQKLRSLPRRCVSALGTVPPRELNENTYKTYKSGGLYHGSHRPQIHP